MNNIIIEDVSSVGSVRMPIENQDVQMDSSAYNLMRDFNVHRPILIEDGMKAVEAASMIAQCHVNWFVIVDQYESPIGVLQKAQIQLQEIIKKVSQGHKRDDLTIADLMTEKKHLKAISIKSLLAMKVESLLRHLGRCQSNLLLVTDAAETELRGIITVEQVLQKLNMDAAGQYCHSFEDVYSLLVKQREKTQDVPLRMVS